ncbi:MAG: molybdopterin-dependent oxidoreductase, partial [Rhodocyclaceae bacterium]|nr:molybdopterin-dependent oxidoreductase [Rhodocyclaceae bacterium]
MSAGIEFSLDGRLLAAQPGDTILTAARRAGVDIPHLCYKDGLRADGNCRACMVEIDGERALAPACCRSPAAGMQVAAASARARQAQRLVLELLRADVPAAARHGNSELEQWCARLGVGEPRFAGRPEVRQDSSHPAIKVDLDACIQCTRCLRACRETQANDVIGYAGRGADARIVFDQEAVMGKSSCVGCGECVQTCPTGALRPAAAQLPLSARVSTLCPYCGVGCQVRYDVAGHGEGARIVAAEGLPGPANAGRLCVKGRYGYDYARHAERLTRPLVRKPGVPKDPARPISATNWDEAFRVASWDEALDAAAGGLARIKAAHGAAALAGFGSAKGSNEEAYLFQKFVRAGMGTNNVDHCTRLCHASSVAALLEGIGSGAVSNPVSDVAHADVIIVIGANPAGNHPVAATFMKNAARRGARLILMDPRATPLARHAWRHLQFKPDTDVAMLNALAYVIATEGLTDIRFIAERTNGYEEFLANLADYAPEKIAPVCGIDAATLRE